MNSPSMMDVFISVFSETSQNAFIVPLGGSKLCAASSTGEGMASVSVADLIDTKLKKLPKS